MCVVCFCVSFCKYNGQCVSHARVSNHVFYVVMFIVVCDICSYIACGCMYVVMFVVCDHEDVWL